MQVTFKNPIIVYPVELLEQAIYAAAHQNHEQDKQNADAGEVIEFTDEHLSETRHLLTSEETDYANYVPEDESLPVIVMLNSSLAKDQVVICENCIEGFVMNGAQFYKHYFESESNPKGRIDCCKSDGIVVNSLPITEIEYFVDNNGRGFNYNEILSEKYFKAKPINFSELINKLKEVKKPGKLTSVLDSDESLLDDDVPF